MKKLFGLTLALLLSLGFAGHSQATIIVWQNETFTGISNAVNNQNFDAGSISFAPFAASSLDDVFGTGIYHNHSGSKTFSLDIMLNGGWTNIWSNTIPGPGNQDILMDSISTPIAFAPGLVSGIRLAVDASTNQGFHLGSGGQGQGTSFQFGSVPAPATLALFGLGLLGLGFSRRSKR